MSTFLPLSRERRHRVCIHEAAHAVVHALGGAAIYSLAVAPEGSTEWTYEHRKGGTSTDLYGACATSDIFTPWLRWSDDEMAYTVNRIMLRQAIDMFRITKSLAEHRRQVRAQLCGLLAGPLADDIYGGEQDPFVEPSCEQNEDATRADGLSITLPFRNEFWHAQDATLAALREPATWQRIVILGDRLETAGTMVYDEITPFLPPTRKHWPPTPRTPV